MKKFYSSLIINSKNFPDAFQVFKPRFNKEFFKRLTKNLDQLKSQADKRNVAQSVSYDLKQIKDDSNKFIKARESIEKLEKDIVTIQKQITGIRDGLYEVEDRLMPVVLSLPNRTSSEVPDADTVIEEYKPDPTTKDKLTKVLSHIKLSYINECYSKSVVGPNSHYYYGIGAKLQHGLSNFFTEELMDRDFIPVSGLNLVKSAVVEAANVNSHKNFMTDPCRILSKEDELTSFHLVESSREAFLGFITTLKPPSSTIPLKMVASGAGYRSGSYWFDSDDKKVSQFETCHAFILNSSIENYSMKEFNGTKDTIWDLYKLLELPSRLVHCSPENMLSNEYDSYRIDVWLPSKASWIQVSRISHYLDYLTLRAGMKRGHVIDSMVHDGQVLAAAIIENNQTSTGKFIIPSVIKNHMIHLDDDETKSYFREMNFSPKQTLINHQQKRYLVKKKNYRLAHSKEAYKRMHRQDLGMVVLGFCCFFLCLVDWKETWIVSFPDFIKRPLYDYIYRPSMRVWYHMVYTEKPDDTPFDQLDRSHESKSVRERRRDELASYIPQYAKVKPEDIIQDELDSTK